MRQSHNSTSCSTSAKRMALALPVMGMATVLAWSTPAWSVGLAASDYIRTYGQACGGLVLLVADSGDRGAGQGPPTGTSPGSGRGSTGGTGKGGPGGTGPGSGMGSTGVLLRGPVIREEAGTPAAWARAEEAVEAGRVAAWAPVTPVAGWDQVALVAGWAPVADLVQAWAEDDN